MASISRARFGAGLGAAAVVAAAGMRPARADAPFDPGAYAHYRRIGRGVITGTLAVQLETTQTQTKSGATLIALPDTPLTRSWLTSSARDIAARQHGPNEFDDPAVPDELVPFVREARTRTDGSFTFRDLPNGTYLIRGRLSIPFDRSVDIPVPTNAVDAQGHAVPGDAVAHVFVTDYSFVWLDSNPVIVTQTQASDVTFHIVARRDKFDPRR